jgi:protein SCO1/2
MSSGAVTAHRVVGIPWGVLVTVLLCAVMSACGQRQAHFALHDISGLMPALRFDLTDQDGRSVTAADYRGKIVLLYFGYTSCPDACPTTLAKLANTMHTLGGEAERVRVLFVSVDPQRDTAAVLKRYVTYFGPQFIGLRSRSDGPLDALTRRYRVAYHREPPDHTGDYTVDHSSAIFIFDRDAKARLLADGTESVPVMVHDLRQLMGDPSSPRPL